LHYFPGIRIIFCQIHYLFHKLILDNPAPDTGAVIGNNGIFFGPIDQVLFDV